MLSLPDVILPVFRVTIPSLLLNLRLPLFTRPWCFSFHFSPSTSSNPVLVFFPGLLVTHSPIAGLELFSAPYHCTRMLDYDNLQRSFHLHSVRHNESLSGTFNSL
jgi:hypothetical protein